MGIELGQVIDGKYRVISCLGEGGMGAVYAGEHLRLHRRVAIKVLHATMAGEPSAIARFEREAQAAGRIGNDHILEVLDIGHLPDGTRYLVMEFLDGESMSARIERLGRMTPRDVYPLARQVVEGLVAAHAAGIVHRDLKPANIFILREKMGLRDYVKIIDFGISKFQSLSQDPSHRMTRTGSIIGTPAYMAPEQARGLHEADARSDLYALGVVLYEAVTGRLPFVGANTNDLLFQIVLGTPPPIESLVEGVDPAFSAMVARALAKEPADRFASAAELLAALDAWADAQPGWSATQAARLQPATVDRLAAVSRPIDAAPVQTRAALPVSVAAPGTPRTEGPWGGQTSDTTTLEMNGGTRGRALVAVGAGAFTLAVLILAPMALLRRSAPAAAGSSALTSSSAASATVTAQPELPPSPVDSASALASASAAPAQSAAPPPTATAPPDLPRVAPRTGTPRATTKPPSTTSAGPPSAYDPTHDSRR